MYFEHAASGSRDVPVVMMKAKQLEVPYNDELDNSKLKEQKWMINDAKVPVAAETAERRKDDGKTIRGASREKITGSVQRESPSFRKAGSFHNNGQ